MKKKILSFSIIITTILSINIAYAFRDVSSSYKYSTAINYLAQNGVINGYPDGTFQPEKNISRVEFLKIIMEGSGVVSDVTTPTQFKDIDETAWYAKYIRKAKSMGWISGYQDNTFKPAQNINKVEALKIIAKVQNWQTVSATSAPYLDVPVNTWFTDFVLYAKQKNFLEETGPYLVPDALLNRGQVSEIIFRTFITKKYSAPAYTTSLILNDPSFQNANPSNGLPSPNLPTPQALNFTPVTYKTIAANTFSNVTLGSDFPNTFYQNEIYHFQGLVSSNTYQKAFVFLAPSSTSTDTSTYTDFESKVTSSTFDIPVYFKTPGNYKLGLIPGTSGQSKVISISVLPALPASDAIKSDQPTDPKISYIKQQTSIALSNPQNEISRVVIYQDNNVVQYLTRQPINSIDLQYQDFMNFHSGTVYYEVQSANLQQTQPLNISSQWVSSNVQQFNATDHLFTKIDTSSITLSNFRDTLNAGESISFNGTVNTNTYLQAAIIKANGMVEEFNLSTDKTSTDQYGQSIIAPGGYFSFNYTPQTSGNYSIEINNTGGQTILNTGIYIGGAIPLIPNFLDIDANSKATTDLNLNSARTELLNLINSSRQKYGLQNVTLDSALNNLAQLHSEDMVNRNYFGHVDPDGLSPDDRRKKLGISTPVGENIAASPNVAFANAGLMASAIHRENILTTEWTKVGLGIAKNSDGDLYITEEFSGNPLTTNDTSSIKTAIINQISSLRTAAGVQQLQIDTAADSVAADWSNKMVSQNFFSFNSPNGESLSNNIQSQLSGKSVQAVILSSSSQDKILQQVQASPYATSVNWNRVGIGVNVDNLGTIKVTILYTMSN